MTMLSVCWPTASAFSSSCRLICRSYSFQNSTVKEATPNSSMMSIVLPRITWFARRAASLFLLGLSVMPVLLSERRGRFPRSYAIPKQGVRRPPSYSPPFASL